MISIERINEVFDNEINAKKLALKNIDKIDNGKNIIGTAEWKVRNHLTDEIKCLEEIRSELIE